MRCLVTLKDGGAMERAVAALAKYRYTASGEPVAPEGHPRDWKNWLLEINSAEFDAIRDHVDLGDVVEINSSWDQTKQ
jgi:hypothetical protein